MVTMVLARVGGFNQCASPNTSSRCSMHVLCPERWTLGLGGPGSLSTSRGLGEVDQHPEGRTENTLHLVWLPASRTPASRVQRPQWPPVRSRFGWKTLWPPDKAQDRDSLAEAQRRVGCTSGPGGSGQRQHWKDPASSHRNPASPQGQAEGLQPWTGPRAAPGAPHQL